MRLWVNINKARRERGRHRDKRRTWWHHNAEYVWPSMGLRAFLRWAEITIKRHHGRKRDVSMGAAIGIFITFSPLVGTHIIQMWLLSRLLKASFWVAFLVALIGNPWTFPLIFAWNYKLGMFLLGQPVHGEVPPFNLWTIWVQFGYFWQTYLWPMLVGGTCTGIVFAVITYFVVRAQIVSFHLARKAFLRQRRQENQHRWQRLRKQRQPKRH